MRELNDSDADRIIDKIEQLGITSQEMRKLEDYSFTDNINYLKEEYGSLYSSLKEMLNTSTIRFMKIRDKVDDEGDFGTVINTLKSAVPQGLVMKSDDPKHIYAISRNNMRYLMDMFESMFLNLIDQYEFEALDPELQNLYFEAQEELKKEEKDE